MLKKKKKNQSSDIRLRIIQHLKKADKPLIAHHIARGTGIGAQLVDYHLKKLVEQGVVLVQREYEHNYYFLQPSFYLEEAETALMKVLTPWIEAFAEATETEEDQDKEQIVYDNLHYYFQIFLKTSRKSRQTHDQKPE